VTGEELGDVDVVDLVLPGVLRRDDLDPYRAEAFRVEVACITKRVPIRPTRRNPRWSGRPAPSPGKMST
jgi:hypothetical protein